MSVDQNLSDCTQWNEHFIGCKVHSCEKLKSKKIVCVRAQLCPTLYDPMDCDPPGSPVREIFQTRILEWVAIASSKGSSLPRDWTYISRVSCIGKQILYQFRHLENSIKNK